MRRTLPAVAAMVLAFGVAGGAGTGLSFLGAGEAHTTASNRAQANADAQRLLAMVRVPAGSVVAATPHDTGFEQTGDFVGGASASATASRTWIIHDDTYRALSFVVAHLRKGSRLMGTGSGSPGGYVEQMRYWPPVRGILDGRWLEITAYRLGTRAYLTARTQSQWVVTRRASERIPANVKKVTIKVTNASGRAIDQLTITKPQIVHRLVRLYNSLGVIQPGTMSCPLERGGSLALGFYGSATKVIATATSSTSATATWPPSTAAWECFPIAFRLEGHSYPSLSGNVITPLAKLIHAKP